MRSKSSKTYFKPPFEKPKYYTMEEVARIIDCGFSHYSIFPFLRDKGILQANRRPVEFYKHSGHFVTHFKVLKNGSVVPVTLVTKKGIRLIKKVMGVATR